MATVLKSIVQFVALVPGVPTALPHGLNTNGLPVVPDVVQVVASVGGTAPAVRITAATTTTVTVISDEAGLINAFVYCERFHSIERALPPGQINLLLQPFIPAGSGVGGNASNVLLPDGGGITRIIFANAGGSDATGTGTALNPYRTLRRALLDVPQFIFNEIWIIDITGLGTESSTTPIRIARYSADAFSFDFAPLFPAFFSLAPLVIRATPTTFDTITAGDITSQTAEPTTGLITINTTKFYALNALRGKHIVDTFGSEAVIASNTAGPASSLEITLTFPMTAPILIVDPSAVIENTGTDFVNPAVTIEGGTANIVMAGISVVNTLFGGTFDAPLQIIASPSQSIFFQLADIPGAAIFGPGGVFNPSMGGIYWDGTAEWDVRGTSLNLGASFFDGTVGGQGISLDGCGPGDGPVFWFGNIFDGLPALGRASSGNGDIDPISLFLSNCIVRNGSDVGVLATSVLAAVRLRDVDIHSCASDGISARGGFVTLGVVTSNGGANGGVGLRLENGATGRTAGVATITGAVGDFKVGGNAASAGGGAGWAAFPGNETDLAAVTPQICRLFT